jgi:Arc/MetJ family transcription regulator
MSKTTVDLDTEKLEQAKEVLHTTTIKETIDAALAQVVAAAGRREFIELARSGYFAELEDPASERRMWG